MNYLTTLTALFLTLWNVSQAAQDMSSTIPAYDTDFVYVVALERQTPDATSEKWKPTLYKIDIKRGSIVQTRQLAEQGAPAYCERLGKNEIRVYIEEGIAANGTFVWEPKTRTVHIDKTSLKITRDETKQGIFDGRLPKNIEETPSHLKHLKSIGTYLGEFTDSKLLVLTSRSKKQTREIKILDRDSRHEIDTIHLPSDVETDLLGWFVEEAVLLNDRFVICLFYGDGRLGYYAPGYVAIIDIKAKQARYVPVGSNPAMGIVY